MMLTSLFLNETSCVFGASSSVWDCVTTTASVPHTALVTIDPQYPQAQETQQSFATAEAKVIELGRAASTLR